LNPKTAKPFVVPVLIAVYLILFWQNISGQELAAVGFPRLLILFIALLIVAEVVREIRRLRRHDVAAPTDAELKGDAQQSSTAPAALATASGTRLSLKERLTTPAYQQAIPMVSIIVFLIGYWFFLPIIGAYPTTAVFVAGLSVVLGYRKPELIIASTVICVVIVGGFIQVFNLPLPTFGS
jgi:hypothetical protein